ncbi:DUF1566 domain-containing protein [Desulfobulbus sp. TB]|nr:DUF1566 domain-containing protein [Desulfobulbus sp. TB]
MKVDSMKKHRNTLQVILPLLFFTSFIHLPGYAAQYSPHVFKIESEGCSLIKDCSSCPAVKGKTAQTGFVVKGNIVQGKSGIITALHGVVGRQSISARDFQRGKSFHDLKIIAVDIDHDLALLSSDKLQKEKEGFNFPKQKTSYKGIEIRCIGYPFDVPGQQLKKQLSIHSDPEILSYFVPANVSSWLGKRGSPNPSLKALNIEGQLLPGYSGAPILNNRDEVVGVADGGLQIGSAMSWAIPYDQIRWIDASFFKETEKVRLACLEKSELFSFTAFHASSGALLGWQEPRAGAMMDWRAANDYVTEKNREGLMGYHDWRLPAVGELQELAKFIKNSPGSYSDTDKLYWSSEANGPVKAKVVNLGNAKMEWSDIDEQVAIRSKRSKFSVRLVRSLIQ